MTILSGILCYAMWLPAQSVDLVIAFTCLYGFCSGIFISVTPAVIGQLTSEEKLGARLGAFFSTTAIATLIGTPIGGALIQGEAKDDYQYLIIFAVSSIQADTRVVRALTRSFQASTLTMGGLVLLVGRILCERRLGQKW